MYCVGLTGNIGSGKSTVASYFESLGIEIISADQVAKDLTRSDQPAFQAILTHFGPSVLQSNGELNRSYLRQLIFTHEPNRRWLEQLLHPMIRQMIKHKVTQVQSPYCIIEIPLLTNKANYPYLNRILLVKSDPKEQIGRFMARDNSTKEDAQAILATQQAHVDIHLAMADDVLMNTGSLNELQKKVVVLHDHYLQSASSG
jgi:dephospho-CoA kinase